MTSPKGLTTALFEAIPDLGIRLTTCPLVGQSMIPGKYTTPHMIICPYSGERRLFVSSVIIHLNDEHEATREFIADWLDTLDMDLSFPIPGRMDG